MNGAFENGTGGNAGCECDDRTKQKDVSVLLRILFMGERQVSEGKFVPADNFFRSIRGKKRTKK
jgi:hypothetical protein